MDADGAKGTGCGSFPSVSGAAGGWPGGGGVQACRSLPLGTPLQGWCGAATGNRHRCSKTSECSVLWTRPVRAMNVETPCCLLAGAAEVPWDGAYLGRRRQGGVVLCPPQPSDGDDGGVCGENAFRPSRPSRNLVLKPAAD